MRKFEVNVEALREYVVDGKTLKEIEDKYDAHAMENRGQYFRTKNKRGGWGKTGNYCGVRYRDKNGTGQKFTDKDFDDYVKKFYSRRGNDAYTIDEYIETELGGQIITEGEYKKLHNFATNPKSVPGKNEETYIPPLKEKNISATSPNFFDKSSKAVPVHSPFDSVKWKAKSILKKMLLAISLLLVGIVLLMIFIIDNFSSITSEYIFDKIVYKNESYYGDERFGKPSNICLKKTHENEFVLADFKSGKIHNAALYYTDSNVSLGQSGKNGLKGYGAVWDRSVNECKIGKFKNKKINGYGLYYDGAKLYGVKYKNSEIVKTYKIKKNKFKGYKIENLADGYSITVKKKAFEIQSDTVTFSFKNYYSFYKISGDCYLSNTRGNGKQYVKYKYNTSGVFDVNSYYELFGKGQYRELSNHSGEFTENVIGK